MDDKKPSEKKITALDPHSRDAVESAIDLAKEHYLGTWEQHISQSRGRIEKWHCDLSDHDQTDNNIPLQPVNK